MPVGQDDIRSLLKAFCSAADWVKIFTCGAQTWRSTVTTMHLSSRRLVNAQWIATNNPRDTRKAELRFPDIQVATPEQSLKDD